MVSTPGVAEIVLKLDADQHPRSFGINIGEGGQRIAYLFGDYVVKRRVPAFGCDVRANALRQVCPYPTQYRYAVPVEPFQKCGVEPPDQLFFRGWVIQPFYRPLTPAERAEYAWLEASRIYWRPDVSVHRIEVEIHPKNLGINPQTHRVHCFDW